MYFWLHQCNLTKWMFFQAWQTPPQCTIHVVKPWFYVLTYCVFSMILCTFLQGACQMSLRTMFCGFYAIFRWLPTKFKMGFLLCVCMRACTHIILSFGCMYVRVHAHTHTYMHTQNLLGIQMGYNVKYEGGGGEGKRSFVSNSHRRRKQVYLYGKISQLLSDLP